jgi:hypothetical protein
VAVLVVAGLVAEMDLTVFLVALVVAVVLLIPLVVEV